MFSELKKIIVCFAKYVLINVWFNRINHVGHVSLALLLRHCFFHTEPTKLLAHTNVIHQSIDDSNHVTYLPKQKHVSYNTVTQSAFLELTSTMYYLASTQLCDLTFFPTEIIS